MPQTSPFASFVSFTYNLKFTPTDLSEPEQLYQRALLTVEHAGALGRVVSYLSSSKLCDNLNEPVPDIQERAEQLDKGLFVLGQMISAINDEAYDAVVRLKDMLTNPE